MAPMTRALANMNSPTGKKARADTLLGFRVQRFGFMAYGYPCIRGIIQCKDEYIREWMKKWKILQDLGCWGQSTRKVVLIDRPGPANTNHYSP